MAKKKSPMVAGDAAASSCAKLATMISARTEGLVWRVALGFCLGAAVLLGVVWVVGPDDLPGIRILLSACALALVLVTGLTLARAVGMAVPGGARRWASLIVGALGSGHCCPLSPPSLSSRPCLERGRGW